MKVTGSAVLHAPREKVWSALQDPAVLVRTIPGCQQLEQVGPDSYRATVTAGVASIKGTYTGDVRLTDQAEPKSFVLHAAGSGAPGTVSADVRVNLADADGVARLGWTTTPTPSSAASSVGSASACSPASRRRPPASSLPRSTTSSPAARSAFRANRPWRRARRLPLCSLRRPGSESPCPSRTCRLRQPPAH